MAGILELLNEMAKKVNAKLTAMVGATANANGRAGLVPAPVKGKHRAFLRGDGIWSAVIVSASVTIPTTGWKSDSTADYPYYYDIPCSGTTVSDKAVVLIAEASAETAKNSGMSSRTETRSGAVRIRAKKVPTGAVSAQYWIFGG